ncbi:MAG: hypothetical protein KKE64_05385 [Candidatus Omnitrophica bacterium]|nr:hypothetical protein [Candidatus Omnitrophota bacterium]
MQKQLVILENKIDTLLSQSSEKSFKSEYNPRPFQRFDRQNRYDKRSSGDNFRERNFTKAICAECNKECEVPFKPTGDRPVYCKICFAKRKDGGTSMPERNSGFPREGGFSRKRHFDKKPDEKNLKFSDKKPNFRKRKERKK